MGVRDNQMNFIFFIHNRKNYNKNIVQSISFYNKLSIENSISKNKSRSEYFFERVENIITERVKLPENIFLDKMC